MKPVHVIEPETETPGTNQTWLWVLLVFLAALIILIIIWFVKRRNINPVTRYVCISSQCQESSDPDAEFETLSHCRSACEDYRQPIAPSDPSDPSNPNDPSNPSNPEPWLQTPVQVTSKDKACLRLRCGATGASAVRTTCNNPNDTDKRINFSLAGTSLDGEPYYHIYSNNTSQCAPPECMYRKNSGANEGDVGSYNCNKHEDQNTWYVRDAGEGKKHIINRESGYCLFLSNNAKTTACGEIGANGNDATKMTLQKIH